MSKTIGAVDGYDYTASVSLSVLTCYKCHVPFGLPERMLRDAKDLGNYKLMFYCPNGHRQGYGGKSAAKKAQEDAEWYRKRHEAERDLREHTERRLAAQKGATTKAKKRHAAGVCPCCSRSFKQLRRHMASQHPDFLAEHGIEPVVAGQGDNQ